MRGKFITFEGDDGLGKTTQAELLVKRLQEEGYDVKYTYEPGGTDVGTLIREITHHYKGDLSNAAEMLLFQADRAQHYKEVLKPALKAGKIVVCDRYLDSTLVYQGALRGWKTSLLWRLHSVTTGMLLPDLTLVFDGNPHTKGDKSDRFEREGDDFHARVRRAYRVQVGMSKNRSVLVDANQDRIALSHSIYELVRSRLLH